jgi:hypothetical protein
LVMRSTAPSDMTVTIVLPTRNPEFTWRRFALATRNPHLLPTQRFLLVELP